MNAMQDLPSTAMSSNQNESGGGGGAGPPLPTAFKSPSTDGKSGSRRSTRFKDEDEYVEVTLDVRDGGGGGDDVAVLAIKDDVRDDTQDAASLLDRPAPGGAGGGLSSKLRAARARLGRIASGKRAAVPLSALLRRDPDRARLDRSVVTALRGLQFLNQAAVTEGWPEVEKRFHRLAVDGFLLRSRFGQCIGESPNRPPLFFLASLSLSLSLHCFSKPFAAGMIGSEEFAAQIFDALARRRGITAMVLTKDQVREFWEQLSDPGFDAKLQTFFDMYVMTGLPTPIVQFFLCYQWSSQVHSDTTFRNF